MTESFSVVKYEGEVTVLHKGLNLSVLSWYNSYTLISYAYPKYCFCTDCLPVANLNHRILVLLVWP